MECSQDDRLDRRRRAFVQAGLQLFIEQGFERTTLADVVERAGGSLATLYKLFGNKAGLLAAVVGERARSGESLIAEISERDLEPAAALHCLGKALRKRLLDPESVAISRVVIAYSLEDAEFASDFYRRTLLQSQQTLTGLFERWRQSGVSLQGDPTALASVFLGMFVYELHSEAISHGAIRSSEFGQLEDKIDFFCRGAGLSG